MRILALGNTDVTNIRLNRIICKLLERGHEVKLYNTNMAEHNIRMFKGAVNINPIENLDDQAVSDCDVILCTNDTVYHVMKYKKYIFLYNAGSALGSVISEGGDFMFLPSDMQYVKAREHCASMVVGDPQYEKMRKSPEDTEKNILFIDCGHFPFGRKGKMTLAKLIIEICMKYPEYTVKIKPRFLESDSEGRTHNNRLHLYECIRNVAQEGIPDNLYMLDYHEEMNVLMDWAGLVICPYTSSYVDAVVRDKRLLVISGLPNEDSVNLNNHFIWKVERDVIGKTGCLVDYREIFEYLPEGKHCCSEEKERLFPYAEGAADRIVEVMEFLWDNALSKGKLPERKEYQYLNYQQEIPTCLSDNWNEILTDRMRNRLVYEGTRYLDAVPYSFDIKHYVSWVESLCDSWNPMMCRELEEINRQYINHMIVNNEESLLQTSIGQSYLMEAYFTIGRFEEFEKKYFNQLRCERAYSYYKGRYELGEKNFKEAELYLEDYLTRYDEFEWEEYVADYAWAKQIALRCRREIFPFSCVEEASKVILYGAGDLGRKYWEQSKDYCNIVAMADKNAKELFCLNTKLIEPNEIRKIDYDKIVICVRDEKRGDEMKQNLSALGISNQKVIYR